MRRKVFIVFFTALFLLSCSKRENVSIKKVEHFYISSNNTLDIFKVLTEQFGLPKVWEYQNWGNFTSGGITLGNVVIELIEKPPEEIITHYGIALEPSQPLKRTISVLDSANITHGRVSRASQWSTVSLTNLLPDSINLFLCDYHDRDFVTLNRKKAVDKLVSNKGGKLGIQFLKEIRISAENPAEFENELAKIPGIVKKENEFYFSEGPYLKLIKSDTFFLALLIKVKSIDKAKLELERLNLRTKVTEQGVEIIDEIFSTRITLIE
ncbi:hypothetical protein [Aquimarina sp. 2201CG5-10]|uniref:hypothetical protein n=1 Tax=Aquimarina callyspongiae TaxID=3098150 RepID=UPI002AB4B5FD|nr:hypothetical protein [Aquimarina sp. 2201CG5-10]MDY8137515.1 hypothetical protein [Aquimarina sp. 2201CG5-10]